MTSQIIPFMKCVIVIFLVKIFLTVRVRNSTNISHVVFGRLVSQGKRCYSSTICKATQIQNVDNTSMTNGIHTYKTIAKCIIQNYAYTWIRKLLKHAFANNLLILLILLWIYVISLAFYSYQIKKNQILHIANIKGKIY